MRWRWTLKTPGPTRGLVAELDTPEALTLAVGRLREAGMVSLDTYTPYPVHGVEELMRLRRSSIGWLVLPLALAGGAAGYLLQWWCNAWDYPLDVGGRPPHSLPTNVPITFEMTVLVAAWAGLLAFFWCAGLPRLWHPLFEIDGFERASVDRFFVFADADDPAFDAAQLAARLADAGALRVIPLGLEPVPAPLSDGPDPEAGPEVV